MSQTIEQPPVIEGSSPEDLKLARRATRRFGLFAPHLMRAALKQSFVMLRPDIQWKNPVMFVVEVGTVLSIVFTFSALITGTSRAPISYLISLDIWLLLTVLFANFASALAEARGKAQANSLRKTRRETPAFRISTYEAGFLQRTVAAESPDRYFGQVAETSSTDLQAGDVVLIETGQVIPGDGEIVEGVASIDESPITGESAPVIRE